MSIINRIEFALNYLYSIWFCLHVFSIKRALNVPILMHYRTKWYISKRCKGIVEENGIKHPVRIGINPGSYNLGDRNTHFCIYDNGSVIFHGLCKISRGTIINVRSNGELSFGNHFFCNSNCNIFVNQKVVFKDYVLIGWNVSILDDDGHELIEKDHLKESQKPILIEDKTWLASNSTILKGVSLAHESIVPYGSIIYKSNQTPNAIWANKIIKENITRIL